MKTHSKHFVLLCSTITILTPSSTGFIPMWITFHKEEKHFHIRTRDTSYIIGINKEEAVEHLYWGERIQNYTPKKRPRKDCALNVADTVQYEYPQGNRGDTGVPAFEVFDTVHGCGVFDLVYRDHKITSSTTDIPGLPCLYTEEGDEVQTLEIELADEDSGLQMSLFYTVFAEYNAITRRVTFTNLGNSPLHIRQATSWSVDLPPSIDGYDTLRFHGSWSRECQWVRSSIQNGSTVAVESRKGISSHSSQPFVGVLSPDATEDFGDVYALSFVYSGSFRACVESSHVGFLRVNMGLHPDLFTWKLDPDQSFYTPECVGVFSNKGLGLMSHRFHRIFGKRLIRGPWRDEPLRPVVLNTWEACYFTFDEARLLSLARQAKDMGVDAFVLDDGWFGHRDDDTSSLGDWYPHPSKFPNGLRPFSKTIRAMGMKFGLWVEPETVSPDSDLFRSHPEWAFFTPHKKATQIRNEYLLDLSNPEVQCHLITVLSHLFREAEVDYIKWDFNRYITEAYSPIFSRNGRDKEIHHRYILGLYHILQTLTTRFPNVLFVNCASGGGRFDAGMLPYFPQTWASDNTDAVDRVQIQYGFSFIYPLSSIDAHVSAVPNHQTRRVTSWKTRVDAAQIMGPFGFELDVTSLDEECRQKARDAIFFHKRMQPLLHEGKLYRIHNPFRNNISAMLVASEDQREAALFIFYRYRCMGYVLPRLRLKGLCRDYRYRTMDGAVYNGDELMSVGLELDFKEDFETAFLYFQSVSEG